ncbi:MAG: GNAT family N-acetyltransferase [Candidatus Doudnabacteria bacterium]|nr:GNAT family N-acetyltransferase [Candidatus Doudnabacteria bacterium]
MSTSFRVATVHDAPSVAEVYVMSRQRHYRGLMPDAHLDALTIERSTRAWERRIGSADIGATTVLLEEDGVLVGFAMYQTLEQDQSVGVRTAYQRALYVHPDQMKRGFGRALVEEVLRRLREEGYEQLVLWALAGNTKSCAFYEHMGFERVEGATRLWNSGGSDPFQLEQIQYRMIL